MASLAIQFGNRLTRIDPTIPGPAAAFAGYAGQRFDMKLLAFVDNGDPIVPIPDDISWNIQDTNRGTLSATIGVSNSVTIGTIPGQTTISVIWKSRNIRGTFMVYCVAQTSPITVSYDDGTIVGQVIKLVSEPSGTSSNDPTGNTKIVIVDETKDVNIANINSITNASSIKPRGSIIRMTDALSVTGDGLHPLKIKSNVGDPINITKTLSFRNKTLNTPIQITIRVADYFDIQTPIGNLQNYNFVIQPQEIRVITYTIDKDVIKTMVPNVYTIPVKINAISLDAGQIFLE